MSTLSDFQASHVDLSSAPYAKHYGYPPHLYDTYGDDFLDILIHEIDVYDAPVEDSGLSMLAYELNGGDDGAFEFASQPQVAPIVKRMQKENVRLKNYPGSIWPGGIYWDGRFDGGRARLGPRVRAGLDGTDTLYLVGSFVIPHCRRSLYLIAFSGDKSGRKRGSGFGFSF